MMINLATIEAKLGAIAIGVLLLLLTHLGAYEYGKHAGKQIVISEDTKALNIAMKKNDDLVNKLEVEHENAVNAINTVMSAPIPRMRIPSNCSQAKPTTGGVQAEQGTRLLSGETERVLDSDRQRTWQLWGEAENELNDCRVVKSWVQSQ